MSNIKIELLKDVVKRTTFNLDRSHRGDIVIFTLGLAGEIYEAIEIYQQPEHDKMAFHAELADITWYTIATALLLPSDNIDDLVLTEKPFPGNKTEGLEVLHKALYKAVEHQEKVKKFIRDYPDRPFDYLLGYAEPLREINRFFDITDACDLIELKCRKRFPERYLP